MVKETGTVNGTVRTCVVTGYGINSDNELEDVFRTAGSDAEKTHIRDLIDNPERLEGYHILAFPGGFSFGDHLGSGKVFSYMFKKSLRNELDRFVDSGKLIIGICNGFQVLVKMGVLPNTKRTWEQEVSLIHNASGVFEDSWVHLEYDAGCRCIWTDGVTEMDLPIRHGEGNFITSKDFLEYLERERLVALRYSGRNPNGSQGAVAGITDRTGRIFGLMPHPEAFRYTENHPQWQRKTVNGAEGLKLFRNGVEYIKKTLL